MSSFFARGGQFWLEDQPQFVQAGEFHYFRTPPDQWSQRLGLLKGAGFNALATYIPWLWHQLQEGDSDLDGHSHPMRNLAGFLDLAGEMGFWIIARPGPYIMAETINEGIPPWVFRKYPQAAFISQDGTAQNIASYLHPDFQACVRGWYRAVFGVLAPRQITRGGRILLVQLDNEMGMLQWVRNIMDLNPDTLTRFAAHVRGAYGPALSRRYPGGDLADLLRQGIVNPDWPQAAAVIEDYRRFYRDYLREYASFLLSEAIGCGLEVPPVINIHGFANGGKTFPIGLSQLAGVMRLESMISATDVYPITIGEGSFHQLLLVNEMTKALQNPQQPLFSIEFQAGGNSDFGSGQSSLYDLHSRLCISCGMRAINHYLFCDGENDPLLSPTRRHDWGHPVRKDGTLRKHYFRYPKLSRVLHAYGTHLVVSRPQTVATIGFLLDDFMTEVNSEATRESTAVLTHQREVVLFDLIARGLALTHRPFDAVELGCRQLDAAQTPVCWVMMEKQCDAGTQQMLADYVRRGGRLILAGRMCVEDFHHQPCTLLGDAIGIEQIRGGQAFVPEAISAFGHRDIPASFVEAYSGRFDEVCAARGDGGVVGFVKAIGRGKVMVFGAALAANTLEDLDIVHRMALKMDCPPLFRLSSWADIRLSRGEAGSFLFINNYQDDPIGTTIECEQELLFGGSRVHVPARSGLILPLDWRPRPGVTVHYVTSEIIEIVEEGSALTLRTAQAEFAAELALEGWGCEQPVGTRAPSRAGRVRLQGRQGEIVLRRDGGPGPSSGQG